MKHSTVRKTTDFQRHTDALRNNGHLLWVSGTGKAAPTEEIRRYIRNNNVVCDLIVSYPKRISIEFFDMVFPEGTGELNPIKSQEQWRKDERAKKKAGRMVKDGETGEWNPSPTDKPRGFKQELMHEGDLDDASVIENEVESMERAKLLEEANSMLEQGNRRKRIY